MVVVDELLSACDGRVREATDADAVCGVPSRWVAAPTSTTEVSAVVKACSANGLRVVVRGRGTKLGWGAPPEQVDVVLETTGLDRLVEHAAGDLVVVTEAGRTLRALQDDVSAARQRLGIDPARSGTVGGAVATAATGPLRLRHGGVRDLVIGMTLVRADGVVARSGGKVVKNVAGYDLGKLLTGSFGTLAVITQVAFRLHPVPRGRAWVCVPVTTPQNVHEVVQAVVHSQLVPLAVEVVRTGGEGTLSVGLEGHPDAVRQLARRAESVLGPAAAGADGGIHAHDVVVSGEAPDWWGGEPVAPTCLLKVTHEVGRVAFLLSALDAAAPSSGAVVSDYRGSPAVGTALVGLSGPPADVLGVVRALRSAADQFGGAVVVHEAVPQVLADVDVWGPVPGLQLMRAVKEQFDPQRLLAPGRFVGGI